MQDPKLLRNIAEGLSPSVSGISGNGEAMIFTGEDIGLEMEADLSESDVVVRLRAAGLWREKRASGSKAIAAYWDAIGREPANLSADLVTVGPMPTVQLRATLELCGVTVDGDAGHRLILTDDYLRPEVRAACEAQRSVLLVKPVGLEIWIGPLMNGGDSPYYEDVAFWIGAHRAEIASITGWEYPPQASVAATGASLCLAMGWVASALAGNGSPEIKDGFVSMDLRTMRVERHSLHPRRKRVFVPEEWISRRTGVVSKIVQETEGFGLRHAAAEYVLAPLRGTLHRQKTRGFAYGSGLSQQEARDRAVYEAVERYSTCFDGEEEMIVQVYDPETCIHPNELMLFGDEQYERRAEWNLGRPDAHQVPERFIDNVPIAWMRAEPVGNYPGKLVPAALVLMDYRDETQPSFAVSESTGCAAGQTLEQAIKTGWEELVERDAVALWWYREALRPGIEWASAGCNTSHRLAMSILRSERSLEILDVTTDFGVHVHVAVSACRNGRDPVFSAGAGREPERATSKALRELTQILSWRTILRDRDDFGIVRLGDFQRSHETKTVVRPISPLPKRYVINLTRRRVGLPVVRVMSPGILPNGVRLGGPRLRAAPLELGWICGISSSAVGAVTPCPL